MFVLPELSISVVGGVFIFTAGYFQFQLTEMLYLSPFGHPLMYIQSFKFNKYNYIYLLLYRLQFENKFNIYFYNFINVFLKLCRPVERYALAVASFFAIENLPLYLVMTDIFKQSQLYSQSND